ncbi:MAG: hypothetical protein HQL63_10635 [Magnetococcales bacterium]|nr:hypothetical protein [Magnetococcales bacterium]MBF0322302.1 hypothetical protein [Magnetococcales bacterium]
MTSNGSKRWTTMLSWIGMALQGGCCCTLPDLDTQTLAPPTAVATPPCTTPSTRDQPQWCVGDQWRYEDGTHLRVTAVEQDRATFASIDKPGQWVQRRGLLREASYLGDTERRMVYRSGNPLEAMAGLLAGKPGRAIAFEQEYQAGVQMVRQKIQLSYDAEETVTVPAGVFQTQVLTWLTESLTSDWKGLERWWYAPSIGHYVRLEHKYGHGPAGSRVLLTYCTHKPEGCPYPELRQTALPEKPASGKPPH